ncbi:MAG: riboflavin synthase [Nitrospirae bacterium]|nr:MAG: riboflavin synthase [Nitrospirota bacterium]
MFTGIVVEMGTVEGIAQKGDVTTLKIRAERVSDTAKIGDSISVNGTCLTVTETDGELLSFDLSRETMKTTNLGELKKGSKVNLEPALKPTDPLGGHIVTGHIDGVGRIRRKTDLGQTIEIEIEAEEDVLKYLVKKGSVAVDGISLTVVDVLDDSFKVVIIPHTAAVTTIGIKKTNDTVNIETDIIGKYVERFLSRSQAENSDQRLMKLLGEGGFL